ncbi:histidinol-phosphate transaminase [Nitratifractor sp.]
MRFNKELDQIKTYEAGKPIELVVREFGVAPEDVVKLASNENPLGTSPRVAETIRAHADKAHLYPDDSMFELKEALSRRFGVPEETLIIGAGSDQILEFASRVKLNLSASVLMSRVTFAMYEIYARQQGATILRTEDWRHRPEQFIPMMEEHRPEIVYLCTPNNPTGDAMRREEVFEILDASDPETLVVVDGAYMEYAAAKDPDFALEPSELLEYPNALYLGTFSKAYGLGGMRVGYGIARPEIVRALMKLRPPFNITTLSLAAAITACGDNAFVEESIRLHREQIGRYEAYARERGFDYIESYTNFITWRFGEELDSSEVADALLRRGVIIRDLARYGLNALRITVGTAEQNDRLFAVMDEVLG